MSVGGSTEEQALAGLQPFGQPAAPIAREERLRRLDVARAATDAVGATALLVVAGASLRYFTGVPWQPTERLVAMLLPVVGSPRLICPAFELGSLEADLTVPADPLLWQEDEDPLVALATLLGPNATLAVDPLLPFAWGERLRACGLQLIDGGPVIDGCRLIKSSAELALLAQAKAMTLQVHRAAAAILRPGITASAVIRFIDSAHRKLGARGSSFCAVQFGRATAFPHGLPGDQQLDENALVLIDTGCLVDGYHSDITRTYAFGSVEQDVRDVWDVEKAAQAAAFSAVRPGTTCAAIDAAARRVLEREGFGPDYALPGLPHRTGHGIGLSIHEPAYLVRGDETVLAPGMCFSNEPMIVVPGRFGVRLEDHFHVTQDGADWFTQPQHSIDAPFQTEGSLL